MTTTRAIRQIHAMRPPGSISSADRAYDPASQAGTSDSQIPAAKPPTRAALRTPTKPSRSRPDRATRAADSRKYPRLSNWTTGKAASIESPSTSDTRPKSHSMPEVAPQTTERNIRRRPESAVAPPRPPARSRPARRRLVHQRRLRFPSRLYPRRASAVSHRNNV